MSNWDNRTKYDKITHEVIAQVPDDLLAWAVFDYIWFRVGKNSEKTITVLAQLPLGFSVIYHLFTLDGEIDNGGFNQYFFNRLDRDAEQQLEALEQIRAVKHQQIFQKAFRIHDQEKGNEELQRRHVEQTMNECDDGWYALAKEFDSLIVEFIRTHPGLFVTEKQGVDNDTRTHER